MQKSLNPAGKASRPSTASPARPKSRRVDSEVLTIQQSYQSLSYTTSQLHLISQALETVNKEKAALADISAQLRRGIAKAGGNCQALKKNHERLHNETIKINKATERLEAERILMEKECQALETETGEHEASADKAHYDVTKLRAVLSEERTAVESLTDMTGKMKKELALQLKERDALRTETATASRVVEQLRDKIEKLRGANQKFMRQLKTTARALSRERIEVS